MQAVAYRSKRRGHKRENLMIPGIPSMGGAELLIILAIVMLLFGAKRIPELGRSLGRSIREFRKGASSSENHDDNELLCEPKERKELPHKEKALT